MTSTGVLCYVLMLTSIADFIIQTNIVAPDLSSLIWVRNVCNKDVKWSSIVWYIGIMYLKIGFYALCAQQMLMDRNACVIPIIKDNKTPYLCNTEIKIS